MKSHLAQSFDYTPSMKYHTKTPALSEPRSCDVKKKKKLRNP